VLNVIRGRILDTRCTLITEMLPRMPRVPSITMADIAREVRVSVSTVSLALRNSQLIAAATRARIRAAAGKLGYRPDPLISALMRRRRTRRSDFKHTVLAFVTAFPTRSGWRTASPMFPAYLTGAARRAGERGYRLEEFWISDRLMPARRLSNVLVNRGIRGVLLAPVPNPKRTIDFDWREFSVVALGLSQAEVPVHRATHDHYHAMLMAIDRCRALGYRRIGLALSALANRKMEGKWLAAYLLKCAELGLRGPRPLIAEIWHEEAVKAWYLKYRPDVIVSTNPTELVTWLSRWGLFPPRDIGLVNLSCATWGDRVSGVFQDPEEVGERAVDLLINDLENNEQGLPGSPNTLLVHGRWNEGHTVAPQIQE
jgi:DNA-binding LacI/PurR family transcriptional regulator